MSPQCGRGMVGSGWRTPGSSRFLGPDSIFAEDREVIPFFQWLRSIPETGSSEMKWDDSKEHLAPKHVWPVKSSGGLRRGRSSKNLGCVGLWDHHYHRSEISLVG